MNLSYSYQNNHPASLKTSFFFLIVLFVSLAMIGCGNGSSGPDLEPGPGPGPGPGPDPGTQPPAGEVWMEGTSFSPSSLEVTVGTTVRWENKSSETHTVTSGSNRQHDGLFDSGNIGPGGEFSYTFDEVGTFDYYCEPHAGMSGTVTVVE